jgi:hypothetical protein
MVSISIFRASLVLRGSSCNYTAVKALCPKSLADDVSTEIGRAMLLETLSPLVALNPTDIQFRKLPHHLPGERLISLALSQINQTHKEIWKTIKWSLSSTANQGLRSTFRFSWTASFLPFPFLHSFAGHPFIY